MAVAGQSEVKGFDELFKAMDALSEEIGKGKTDRIWRKALEYAFEPVLRDAKDRAPVASGQLKEHLYIKAHKPTNRDKQSFSYQGEMFMVRVTSSPKRQDSTAHTTIIKGGKERTVWNNRPVGLANEFGTAKNAAQPFLRPALEVNIQNVQDRLAKAIWYELEWGKWTKKG
jgi:HK97 gp10 family phage protein